MSDIKDIVKLGIDGYKGTVEKYSVKQSQDTLREALIEANNGSTKLDYKAIRDGKCTGLFAIVEEILNNTVVDGLLEDDFFNEFVEYRNVGEGDLNMFVVEDNTLFVVDDISEGNQGIRRQRLSGYNEISIPTSVKAIRIYEELIRVLSGRVDFNQMIAKVGDSFRQKILMDIYSLWSGATAAQMGGSIYNPGYPTAGNYSEDALLDLIAHVEAQAGGKNATIIGTKKALRVLKESIQSDGAKEELHNMGYYGRFFGTPCMAVPQRHQLGTTSFMFPDNVLTVVAGPAKPFKFVREGDPLVIMGDPLTNADLTQEYVYIDRWGLGIVLAGDTGIGRYQFS